MKKIHCPSKTQKPIHNGADTSTINNNNVTTTSIATVQRDKSNYQEGIGVNDTVLLSREVNRVGSEGMDEKDVENVKKVVKMALRNRIMTLNSVIKERIGEHQLIRIEAKDDLEQMAHKCVLVSWNLYVLGHYDLLIRKVNLEYDKLKTFLDFAEREMGLEVICNAKLITNTLLGVCGKKAEVLQEQEVHNSLSINQQQDDFVEIDVMEYRERLGVFKNEYYFSKLRDIMSPENDLKSKIMLFNGFSRKINSEATVLSLRGVLKEITNLEISNITYSVNWIQSIIDFLDIVEDAKTKKNIEIAVDICKKCLNYYIKQFEGIKVLDKRSGLNSSPYKMEHCNVMRLLRELIGVLERSIRPVEDVVEGSKPLCGKQKKKIRESKNRKTQQKVEGERLKKAEEARKVLQDIVQEEEKSELLTEEEELAFDFEEVEEEEVDDIEREANELMEIMRQFIERDREKKLRQREAAKARSVMVTKAVQGQMVVDVGPGVRKLNTQQRETVKLLFQNTSPPHYVISRGEVESLIGALGGRTDGAGNGSRFKIFWGASKKQAGMYEVAHRISEAGLLTSVSAAHVADAINVGIRTGYIASATISDVL